MDYDDWKTMTPEEYRSNALLQREPVERMVQVKVPVTVYVTVEAATEEDALAYASDRIYELLHDADDYDTGDAEVDAEAFDEEPWEDAI